MLLECLVSIEDADSALKGQLLGESSVETISEKISTAVLEDAVDMSTLRRYFDGDAWLCVQQVLTEKEGRPCWICDVCEDDLALHDSICCDACLHWSHLKCLGKCRAPKSTQVSLVNLLVLQRLQEIAIQMSCLEDKTALFIFEICPSHLLHLSSSFFTNKLFGSYAYVHVKQL